MLLVLWFGGTLVIRGEIKLADLTSFLLLTISIAASLGVLSNVFSAMMSALGANRTSNPFRKLPHGGRVS